MDLKKPLTVDEQIERLKQHNYIVDDEEATKEFLKRNNYYRVTGYALQYRLSENDSVLKEGIPFSRIMRLMAFDNEMRSMLRSYIETVELYYRSLIAYHFSLSRCTCPPYDQHYDESNYKRVKEFRELKQSFIKDRKYYKDTLVMKHHKKQYNDKLPLWAIVELLSFSDLSKFYACMEDKDGEVIAKSVGVASCAVLTNHLHCLTVLRNRCAHAARLYNDCFDLPARFSTAFLKKNPGVKNNSLFAYIRVLKMSLPSSDLRKKLVIDLASLLGKYSDVIELALIGFPSEWMSIL